MNASAPFVRGAPPSGPSSRCLELAPTSTLFVALRLLHHVRMRPLFLVIVLLGCQGGAVPAPSALEPSPLDGLPQASRSAAIASPIPVLLLPEEHNARSIVTSGRGFYAISARDGEITISLHATDIVHAPGDGLHRDDRQHTVRGRPARVLVNEGIRSVAWEEGAVSYALEVECFHPFEDPRCTEDTFVVELANGLVEVPR